MTKTKQHTIVGGKKREFQYEIIRITTYRYAIQPVHVTNCITF